MRRFLVVYHPNPRERLSVHHLLRGYHGESIDAEHTLVLADIDSRHLETLENHPGVLVAPSIFSDETVHAHAQQKDKHTHFLSLQRGLGLAEHHQTSHLARLAIQRFGAKFHLDI
jgi:hypothetical protein